MKIPPLKIKSNDFSAEHRQLTDTLGGMLNPFFDKIVSGFNKNLTIDENLPFEIKTLDMKVDSSGIPLVNGIIQTNLNNFKGFICINITVADNNYPTSCPFIISEVSGSQISIRKIIGLAPNITYRLVLLGIS